LFLGLNNCDDVLPIYIGDDRTDEDAFKVYLACSEDVVAFTCLPVF